MERENPSAKHLRGGKQNPREPQIKERVCAAMLREKEKRGN